MGPWAAPLNLRELRAAEEKQGAGDQKGKDIGKTREVPRERSNQAKCRATKRQSQGLNPGLPPPEA